MRVIRAEREGAVVQSGVPGGASASPGTEINTDFGVSLQTSQIGCLVCLTGPPGVSAVNFWNITDTERMMLCCESFLGKGHSFLDDY